MSDSEKPERKALSEKKVIATKVTGTVKWFNVKSGYGFINRNDTKEDVFVHQTAIAKNNPKKYVRSVGDGETVEFDVVEGEKGNEASNVTGPEGGPVQGSPYAADKKPGFRRYYPRRRYSSRGEGRTRNSEGEPGEDGEEGVEQGKGDGDQDGRPPRGPRGPPRGGSGRPRFRGFRPVYRRRGPPRDSENRDGGDDGQVTTEGEGEVELGPDGTPRRFPQRRRGGGGGAPFRGYYRRGPYRGPRRNRSSEGQTSGTDTEANKENEEGGDGEDRPRQQRRYRRRPAGPPRPRRVNSGGDASSPREASDAGALKKQASDKIENAVNGSVQGDVAVN